jgi:hypothetical protein
MQTDAQLGKVKKDSLTLISRAIELFEKEFVLAALAEASKEDSTRITVAHLKRAAESDPKFEFLLSIFQGKEEEDEEEPVTKRAKPEL